MTNLTNLTPVEIDTTYVTRLRLLFDAGQTAAYAYGRVLKESGKLVYIVGHRSGAYVRRDCPLAAYGSYPSTEVEPHVLTVEVCIAEGLATAAAVDAYCAANVVLSEARVAVAEIDALAFVSAPGRRLPHEQKPSPGFIGVLQKGAADWQLSAEYRAVLAELGA
jgi:hypothetical protein